MRKSFSGLLRKTVADVQDTAGAWAGLGVVVAAAVAVFTIGFVVSAWLVMILVGCWHAATHAVPAIGFVDAGYMVALTYLLAAVAGSVPRRK